MADYAIGVPGERVRVFVRPQVAAERQARAGEVVIEADTVEPATISTDGQSLVRSVG